MGEDLRMYCLELIDEVPRDAYLIMVGILLIGAVILIYTFGFKRGGRYLMGFLLVEYMILLYASTVTFRSVTSVRKYDFTPFWSYRAIVNGDKTGLLLENIMNVVVMVPVGVLAGMAFRGLTWKRMMVIGMCLSLGIEVLQFVMKRGFSEVDDVVHNTAGCLIGYGMWFMVKGKSR